MAAIALFISAFAFAQVTTTPEVPRNYKPKPKELLPMPDSLTTDMIFPVLGKYDVLNKNGDSSTVFITLDGDSKGVIWISGLSEGKFKAELKASPATYKIPSQKTYFNDAPEETVSDAAIADATVDNAAESPLKAVAKKFSGKSVGEGTLIYDKDANQLYINLGSKFNENDPASVFEGLRSTETIEEEASSATATGTKKAKKAVVKGTNYTGSKVTTDTMVSMQ